MVVLFRAKGGERMPVEVLAIKFTEEERALLRRRAKKEKLSEADYLRVCMIMDSMISGDRGALKIMAGRLREKFLARVRRIPQWASDVGSSADVKGVEPK
jgi:hypothetical protein